MIPSIRRESIGGLVVAVAAFAVLLLSTSAFGQSRDQVRGDLEKTDRLIERAEEVVKETGSVAGEGYLEHARELQFRAWEAFRGNSFGQTRMLTLAAREQAMKAIGAVQVSDYNSSTVRRQMDQTDDVLTRARDRIGSSTNQTAISLLEMANDIQAEAKEFLRGNSLKIALKATLKARETANRAVDMEGNSLKVENELGRTDELVDKVWTRARELGSNGSVRSALERAESIQLTAHEEFRSGNLRAAMTRTLRAREQSKKALKLMEKDYQPERIERFLEQTGKLISGLRERLLETPNAEAAGLIEVAVEHQNRAMGAYSAGDLETAMVEAKAARELADRAQELIEG